MMKNKKITYALIVLVALLWGGIIYRIFSAVSQPDDEIETPVVKMNKQPYNDYSFNKDTDKLSLAYRDPFGLEVKIDTPKKSHPVPNSSKSFLKLPTAINWSFVKYTGYIRNPSSKKLIAIMNINGNTVTLAENERADEVKLIKILKDSVKITYQSHQKFIKMN